LGENRPVDVVLSNRELNRATLVRQFLLERFLEAPSDVRLVSLNP